MKQQLKLSGKNLGVKKNGFTLMELLVTIVIAAILASLALPMFTSTLDRSRLTSHTNLMVGALNYARSESINRKVNIQLAMTTNGWEVRNGTDVLKSFAPPANGISTNSADFTVTYAPTGFLTATAEQSITFCDSTNSNRRQVTVAASGSLSVNNSPTTTCVISSDNE